MVLLEYQLESPHLLLFSGSLRTRGLSFWKSLIGSVLQRPENNYAIKRQHILLRWIFCFKSSLCWPFGLWKVLEWATSFLFQKQNISTNFLQIYRLGVQTLNELEDGFLKFKTVPLLFGRIGWPAPPMFNTILPWPIHPTLPCPSLVNTLTAGHGRGKTEQIHIFLKNYPLQINFCLRALLPLPQSAFFCPAPS